MFKLGDRIPASPEIVVTDRKNVYRDRPPARATVVYIHPEGRFYDVRFDYENGSFTESRDFTQEEREAGRRMGLFYYPDPCIIGPMAASRAKVTRKARDLIATADQGNPFDNQFHTKYQPINEEDLGALC